MLFIKKRKRFGLSLRGGGAKCIGYLGGINFLKSEGFEFDSIIASSGGAAVALFYSLGLETQKIIEIFENFTSKQYLGVGSIKERALMDTQKVFDYTYETLKDLTFNDLSKKVIIQAVDLKERKLVNIEEGLLIDAYMATTAASGIRSVYEFGGREYIDGDIMAGYGVKELKDNGVSKVLAMQVKSSRIKQSEPLEMFADSLQLSIKRVLELDSSLNPPDYLLRGFGEGYKVLDFNKATEIYNQGYNLTKKAISNIKSAFL